MLPKPTSALHLQPPLKDDRSPSPAQQVGARRAGRSDVAVVASSSRQSMSSLNPKNADDGRINNSAINGNGSAMPKAPPRMFARL